MFVLQRCEIAAPDAIETSLYADIKALKLPNGETLPTLEYYYYKVFRRHPDG